MLKIKCRAALCVSVRLLPLLSLPCLKRLSNTLQPYLNPRREAADLHDMGCRVHDLHQACQAWQASQEQLHSAKRMQSSAAEPESAPGHSVQSRRTDRARPDFDVWKICKHGFPGAGDVQHVPMLIVCPLHNDSLYRISHLPAHASLDFMHRCDLKSRVDSLPSKQHAPL